MKPRRKPPRRTSTARSRQLVAYRKLKAAFLRSNSHCWVCCVWLRPESRELHHKYGRRNRLLTWEPGFRCVCHRCHQDIHAFPAAAILGGHLGPMGTFNDYNRAVDYEKSHHMKSPMTTSVNE